MLLASKSERGNMEILNLCSILNVLPGFSTFSDVFIPRFRV